MYRGYEDLRHAGQHLGIRRANWPTCWALRLRALAWGCWRSAWWSACSGSCCAAVSIPAGLRAVQTVVICQASGWSMSAALLPCARH